MNSESEQVAPAVAGLARRGHDVLGWFLAVAMALAWFVFWGFWLSPAPPVARAGVSGAPAVSFLQVASTDDVLSASHAVWSPAVFSLPSKAGFSRDALTNAIGARPPLQSGGTNALFLVPPVVAAENSSFKFAPPLEESVRSALTNLPGGVPEAPVYGGAATTNTGVQVELSAGLEHRQIKTMDVPGEDILLKDKPWEVVAFVEFNAEGKVSGVFLDVKSQFDDVNVSLIRALWRWQVADVREPMGGRVTFRSPGRAQVAGEARKAVGP